MKRRKLQKPQRRSTTPATRIQNAWGLGNEYGRRIVADEFEQHMVASRAFADTQDWEPKERAKFLADAQALAYRRQSQNTRGRTTAKRGRWQDAA